MHKETNGLACKGCSGVCWEKSPCTGERGGTALTPRGCFGFQVYFFYCITCWVDCGVGGGAAGGAGGGGKGIRVRMVSLLPLSTPFSLLFFPFVTALVFGFVR